MAILRKQQRGQYTVIDNTIFRDATLSNKALGILCRMLSLPDGWDFSVMGLVALSNDGKSAVMSQLEELEEHGYLRRNQVREGGKIAGIEYVVSEVRMSDFPYAENQHAEKQNAENPTQLNTKELNTNKSTTKRFIAPSIDEVREYIEEKGYSIDPERFVDYYTANGWMVGKSHMKDWKATVRNWERNNGNDTGASGRKPRGLREHSADRKRTTERVATGFIPMATDFPQND